VISVTIQVTEVTACEMKWGCTSVITSESGRRYQYTGKCAERSARTERRRLFPSELSKNGHPAQAHIQIAPREQRRPLSVVSERSDCLVWAFLPAQCYACDLELARNSTLN
jgi:hypothetical protein